MAIETHPNPPRKKPSVLTAYNIGIGIIILCLLFSATVLSFVLPDNASESTPMETVVNDGTNAENTIRYTDPRIPAPPAATT